MFGPARVPAEVAMDLRDAEEAIARIDAKLRLPSVPADVQAATGPEATIDVLRVQVKDLGDRLSDALRWMNHEILQSREESRAWRKQQEVERAAGQAFYRLAILILAAGVALALLLIAAIIGGALL